MVEKIIINPNEVRGLGDIVSEKEATDFTTSSCTINKGADFIEGVREDVYEISDSLLFKDYAVTPYNNTEDWYYTATDISLTVGSVYSYITHIASTGTKVFIANKPGTTAGGYDYTPPFAVEFDLIGYTNNSSGDIQVYDGTRNAYRSFNNMGLSSNELHHIQVLALTDKVEFYADGELKYTAEYTMGNSRTALRLAANGNYIRFRNFTVRQL